MFSHGIAPILRCFLWLLLTSSGAWAAPKWIKLETPEVVIISDASPKDVVEYAVGYSAYRAAFQQLFAPPVRIQRPTVLLFRYRDVMQKNLPPAARGQENLTFSAEVDGAILNALAVEGDRTKALAQTYLFETVFALQRCGYFVPLWMAQGSGEVLESMDLYKGKYEIGEAGNYAWPGSSLAWPRFFEINTSSPEYTGAHADGTYHNQAWALMHRVLLGGGVPAENFARLARLVPEKGALAGVEAFLAVPVDGFTHDIRGHLFKSHRQSYPFDADTLRKRLTPTPAPEPEVHVQLSNLLFAADKPDEGELELSRAQYLDPDSLAVKEARARAALRRREPLEAAELYREAIAKGTTNPSAYLRSAEVRLGLNSGSQIQAGSAGTVADVAIEEIHHALQLDPGNPEAYALLGQAIFLAGEMRDADIAELNRGVTPGAVGASVRYTRALVYYRQKKYAECIADLRTIIQEPYASSSLRDGAKSMLIDVVFKPVVAEVEKLVQAGKFAEASAQLAGARQGQKDATVLGQIDQLLGWVDEQQAWAAVMEATQANDSRLAAERARAFLEKFPRSQLARAARQIASVVADEATPKS